MKTPRLPLREKGEGGFGFIETMIASVILLVGLMAVLGLFAVSMTQEHEQGSVNSRATAYCQTKMEELQALNFGDSTTDTRLWPPANTANTGLCGTVAASFPCGSADPANIVALTTDYLDFNGTRVAAGSALIFFTRQWRIDLDGTGNLKTITVRTTARSRLGGIGAAPFVSLVSLKSR